MDGRSIDDLNTEYSQIMNQVFNGPQGGLDLKKLVVIPGRECWIIYIDALVKSFSRSLLFFFF